MWNTLIYNNESYVIKTVKSTTHKIILSDMINAWEEELNIEDIIRRCKALNPLFTADNDTFIDKILEIMNDITSLDENDFSLKKNAEGISLECKTKLVHMPFKFDFFLKPATAESFCKEITIPLINTVRKLEDQQKILCDLIEKKDAELQQHIFEHGEIKRKNLVTDKFDRNELSPISTNLCCEVFTDEFLKVLSEKHNCSDAVLSTSSKEERKPAKKYKHSLTHKMIKGKKPKPDYK